jgi:hypothetical protein
MQTPVIDGRADEVDSRGGECDLGHCRKRKMCDKAGCK